MNVKPPEFKWTTRYTPEIFKIKYKVIKQLPYTLAESAVGFEYQLSRPAEIASDHLPVIAKRVQVIGPCLHHFSAQRQML